MAKEKAAAPEEEKPGGKKPKKKLIIIVLATVLALGGGAGAYFMFFRETGPPPPPEPGLVVPLDPVTVNLADGHFLKIGLALQATADVPEELDGSKALDAAIEQFSDTKMAELSSAEGRAKAKKELLERIVEAYEHEVIDIYYTQFVMQ